MIRFFVNFIFFACMCLSLEAKPLKIVTSIRPLEGITRAIIEGNKTIELSLIVPKDASPHHIQLKPSQIIALENANLIIWVGGIFESALEPYIHGKPQLRLLGAKGLEFKFYPPLDSFKFKNEKVEHFTPDPKKPLMAGAIDGHIWLDPNQGIIIASLIRDRLSALDPDNSALYQKNYDALKRQMLRINQNLKDAFKNAPHIPYFIFHRAYGYFEATFGIKPQAVFLERGIRAPSAKHLAKIENLVQNYRAVCIFKEPQMKNYLLPIFENYSQITIGTLDPLGTNLPMDSHFYPALIQNLGEAYLICFTKAHAKEELSTCN